MAQRVCQGEGHTWFFQPQNLEKGSSKRLSTDGKKRGSLKRLGNPSVICGKKKEGFTGQESPSGREGLYKRQPPPRGERISFYPREESVEERKKKGDSFTSFGEKREAFEGPALRHKGWGGGG